MFETIAADIHRLDPAGKSSVRHSVAGLLSQGFQAIMVYRMFNWLHRRGISGQPLRFLCERFTEITTGISIPACCSIGKGLRIHHFGGIVFHPTVVMGENCTLYHGVTVGDRGGSGHAARIGDNVLIGAGAKIIGEITIGDNCVIGANAVVAKSMPADTVALGSPCRFKERTDSGISSASVPRIMDFRGTYKGGGGPDKTVLNSAAQHDPEKVFVMVVYIRQPSDQQFLIPEMARNLGLNYVDVPDRRTVDWACLKTLEGIIREQRLQIVHTHDDKTLLYAWLLSFLIPGLKLMHTCHSYAVFERELFPSFMEHLAATLRRKLLLFLMNRHLKPIITVSRDTRQRLLAASIADSDVAVLHNGIDLSRWRPDKGRPVLRDELAIPPGGLLVGTVARITGEKDLPTFYRVAEEVAAIIPNVTFVIVGDGYGDELVKASEEVARRGLSALIRFTGHRTDLVDMYASFDVFLMTSQTEGMPNTLLEAMAMGVPSVSTAVGGIPELLNRGCGGFLASTGDASGLAGHVVGLLRDASLRETCGAAGRGQVSVRFSFSRRVRLMEEYYAWFSGQGALPVQDGLSERGDACD